LPLTASPRVCEMKRYTYLMIRTLLVLTIFAILITAGCQKQPQTQEQPEEKAAPPLPVVSAFYVNGRGENSSFTSFCEHKDIIDELSPLWYRLGGDGTLEESVDSEALAIARENGIKVIPLVALAGNRSSGVLTDPVFRKAAADNISRVVRENGYDGINIDLEIIKSDGGDYADVKEGLTALLDELGGELKRQGKGLNVCVIPPLEPPSHLAPIYDLRALSMTADRVVMMAYDFCHDRTAAGPVAPLSWVKDNIDEILGMGVPPEKLSLGIAVYGYDWASNGTGAVARGNGEINRIADSYNVQIKWDAENQVPFINVL
jgi:spore germination protein